MTVNKLRGHSDKAVSELAKEIVGKWKKDVTSTKPKTDAKAGTAMKRESSSNGAVAKDVPKKATPTPGARKATIADPMKRNHKTDGVNIEFCDDEIRNKTAAMFYDGLCLGAEESGYSLEIFCLR